MKRLVTFALLVLSSTALLQAQDREHKRNNAEASLSSASLSSVSLSALSVVGGDSLIGTVHLSVPAPAEGAVVTLALEDSSESNGKCIIPVSVAVPAGATSASFAIRTGAVSSNATVTILGTYGVVQSAIFLLTDGASTPARTHTDAVEETSTPPTFVDYFNEGTLNTKKWVASNYEVNNYTGGGSDVTFSPANIDLSGGSLRLELTQTTEGTSTGAEITSLLSFGYGTYQFLMRAGSTSPTSSGEGTTESGQISSTFIIHNPPPSYASITEIDAPEIEGLSARNDDIEWTVWKNSNATDPTPDYNVVNNPEDGFHTYKFVWSATSVEFYIDGVLKSTCTSGIPSVAAVIDINFYGTNSKGWGGLATVGVTRYMYVKSAKFWAAN